MFKDSQPTCQATSCRFLSMRKIFPTSQVIGRLKDSLKAKSKIPATENRSIFYPTGPEDIPCLDIPIFCQCYALGRPLKSSYEASSKTDFTGVYLTFQYLNKRRDIPLIWPFFVILKTTREDTGKTSSRSRSGKSNSIKRDWDWIQITETLQQA